MDSSSCLHVLLDCINHCCRALLSDNSNVTAVSTGRVLLKLNSSRVLIRFGQVMIVSISDDSSIMYEFDLLLKVRRR